MDIVVGSGPAGVACARALLDRGRKVLMLDAGLTLEPERRHLVEQFARGRPGEWTAADLAAYQAGMEADAGGVPQKLVYGSDFPYQDAEQHLGTEYVGVGLRPSLAQGGLSNVWGAAVMPYAQRDLAGWPIKVADLAEHYPAALRLTGMSASHDDLENLFPLYREEITELRPSAQARQLLDTMAWHRERLAGDGIFFGRSRLAVHGSKNSANDGCVYCRLCMYGCPYGFIYCSATTVARMQTEPGFTYQPGVIVVSARESTAGIELEGYDRKTRQPLSWSGGRAFLAAGAIPTTRILLRSLGAFDQPVWMKDSQYFLAPMALWTRVPGAMRENLHSLSQIFIEFFDRQGTDRTVHLQIYSYNDLIGQAIAKAFGPWRRPLGFLVRNLQERLLVLQGYLHSDHSSRISLCLKKGDATGRERFEVRAEVNPAAAVMARAVIRKLLRHSRRIGAVPLPIMLKVAEPGRSFHSGGSFPMSAEPRGFQTDRLGRLPGWNRLHAVDATIFPSIPATTITLSVMANAHRIGSEIQREDP
jgi:choline dehydrogenase-like flavoprotein